MKWRPYFEIDYETINYFDLLGSVLSALYHMSEKQILFKSEGEKIYYSSHRKWYFKRNMRIETFEKSTSSNFWNKNETKLEKIRKWKRKIKIWTLSKEVKKFIEKPKKKMLNVQTVNNSNRLKLIKDLFVKLLKRFQAKLLKRKKSTSTRLEFSKELPYANKNKTDVHFSMMNTTR